MYTEALGTTLFSTSVLCSSENTHSIHPFIKHLLSTYCEANTMLNCMNNKNIFSGHFYGPNNKGA